MHSWMRWEWKWQKLIERKMSFDDGNFPDRGKPIVINVVKWLKHRKQHGKSKEEWFKKWKCHQQSTITFLSTLHSNNELVSSRGESLFVSWISPNLPAAIDFQATRQKYMSYTLPISIAMCFFTNVKDFSIQ